MSIQLVDHLIKHPLGILENVQIQASKFGILYDFVVMNMDDNFQVLIILGRPFLATVAIEIDVPVKKISC